MAMDLDTTYAWIVTLSSIGVFIASAELVTLKAEFEDGGLFSWNVLRTISRTTLSVGAGRRGQVMSHRLFMPALTGARALAALSLICFSNNNALSTASAIVIIAASIVMYWRSPLGQDGSDQMFLI